MSLWFRLVQARDTAVARWTIGAWRGNRFDQDDALLEPSHRQWERLIHRGAVPLALYRRWMAYWGPDGPRVGRTDDLLRFRLSLRAAAGALAHPDVTDADRTRAYETITAALRPVQWRGPNRDRATAEETSDAYGAVLAMALHPVTRGVPGIDLATYEETSHAYETVLATALPGLATARPAPEDPPGPAPDVLSAWVAHCAGLPDTHPATDLMRRPAVVTHPVWAAAMAPAMHQHLRDLATSGASPQSWITHALTLGTMHATDNATWHLWMDVATEHCPEIALAAIETARHLRPGTAVHSAALVDDWAVRVGARCLLSTVPAVRARAMLALAPFPGPVSAPTGRGADRTSALGPTTTDAATPPQEVVLPPSSPGAARHSR